MVRAILASLFTPTAQVLTAFTFLPPCPTDVCRISPTDVLYEKPSACPWTYWM